MEWQEVGEGGEKQAQDLASKRGSFPHPLAEVPCSGSQHEVDLVAFKAFEEATQESEAIFEMADHRFGGRFSAKAGSHLYTLGSRLSHGWLAGD